METIFTPYQSLGGGVLIGVASVLLMYVHGRIMGATGILAGIMSPSSVSDWSWRVAVLVGMISGPLAYATMFGEFPSIEVPVSKTMLLVGGFIVGIGVTLGSGCTSGHGVCGMARLSPRSIAATSIFMLTTGLTVYAVRHIFGA